MTVRGASQKSEKSFATLVESFQSNTMIMAEDATKRRAADLVGLGFVWNELEVGYRFQMIGRRELGKTTHRSGQPTKYRGMRLELVRWVGDESEPLKAGWLAASRRGIGDNVEGPDRRRNPEQA